MSRRWAALALVAAALGARSAWPADAPHDYSSPAGVDCNSCHILHKAPGLTLTNTSGNSNLCASCHQAAGPTFAWTDDYQATPGGHGRSHRWDAPVVNPGMGSSLPNNAELLNRVNLNDGNLNCSVCHDQHLGPSAFKGRQRVSKPVGTPVTRTAGSGSGTFVINPPADPDASPKGYRVEVVQAGTVPNATFRISNDNGATWFGYSGGWVPAEPNGRPTGANVALNDGAFVTVTFSGTFAVGDRWDFYVSYPFLRMSVANSELCESCHTSRVQTALQQESGGDGSFIFSHPVGEALSKSYDRLGGQGAILDANGQPQSTGDGVKTNDLKLDTTGKVRCLTCHVLHNADSNSTTEDPL